MAEVTFPPARPSEFIQVKRGLCYQKISFKIKLIRQHFACASSSQTLVCFGGDKLKFYRAVSR